MPSHSSSFERYLRLINRFPLRPLRNEKELNAAIELIDELLQKRLTRSEQDYLDVLSDLVERYEDSAIEFPKLPMPDLLRELMSFRELNQQELGARTGIADSVISEILSGKRLPSKNNIKSLANFFSVSTDVFLE